MGHSHRVIGLTTMTVLTCANSERKKQIKTCVHSNDAKQCCCSLKTWARTCLILCSQASSLRETCGFGLPALHSSTSLHALFVSHPADAHSIKVGVHHKLSNGLHVKKCHSCGELVGTRRTIACKQRVCSQLIGSIGHRTHKRGERHKGINDLTNTIGIQMMLVTLIGSREESEMSKSSQ